ncbi:MAG TPA: PilN domain-containing protein [Longimicrobiales bacterium]|nr:PilN domain-containing protein [Longimicrobiales bacterium]
MIEVNLLPGSRKRPSRGGLSFALPSPGGNLPDRWMLISGALVLAGLAGVGWMWVSSGTAAEEADIALQEAIQDSTRFADIIERTELLTARNDSIVDRVTVIQDIDEGRFVWPHILDEVARALPEYTWLDEIVHVGGAGRNVQFRIGGKAGNLFAQSVFMQQLEASPFLRDVKLIQSEQTIERGEGSGQVVYTFQLEAAYVQPSTEFLETVPLFANDVAPAGGLRPAADTAR